MQVEVRVPFELRARSVFFRSQTVSCCVGLQDTLADKSVTMSDELRQALQPFLVMRKDAHQARPPNVSSYRARKTDCYCRHRQEQMHDLLLPKGRSASSVLAACIVPARRSSPRHLPSDHGEARAAFGEGPSFCAHDHWASFKTGLFRRKARIQRSTTSTTCNSVNHAVTVVTADFFGSICSVCTVSTMHF